jgi:hypothetical protein
LYLTISYVGIRVGPAIGDQQEWFHAEELATSHATRLESNLRASELPHTKWPAYGKLVTIHLFRSRCQGMHNYIIMMEGGAHNR